MDAAALAVPRHLGELTPEWMTAALAPRCSGAVVSKVDVGAIDDGTNRRASVALSYAEGGGPETVFVKVHGRPLHRFALLVLRAWATEARLAMSGVARPLHHPVPYAAAVDAHRLASIVVMDDVTTAGGVPNDGVTPLTVAEVRDGLAGLARLHAAYWDAPLPDSLSFLAPWRLAPVWAPVSAANLARGMRRLGQVDALDLLPSGTTVRELERGFRESARLAATGPQTVLHGDPHPANTYALPGECTGFYDWQLARIGHWSHDVGYFLAGSLEIADRRTSERDLLAGYLDELSRHSAAAPAFDEAWSRYCKTPVYGLATWIHTISAGSFQPRDVCLATIERFAAAYDDLGAHGA